MKPKVSLSSKNNSVYPHSWINSTCSKRFLKIGKLLDFLLLFKYPNIINYFMKRIPPWRFQAFCLKDSFSTWILFWCFKCQKNDHFPWNTSLCRLSGPQSHTNVEKTFGILFLDLWSDLPRETSEWTSQGLNRLFSTCWMSLKIEVLKFKQLTSETKHTLRKKTNYFFESKMIFIHQRLIQLIYTCKEAFRKIFFSNWTFPIRTLLAKTNKNRFSKSWTLINELKPPAKSLLSMSELPVSYLRNFFQQQKLWYKFRYLNPNQCNPKNDCLNKVFRNSNLTNSLSTSYFCYTMHQSTFSSLKFATYLSSFEFGSSEWQNETRKLSVKEHSFESFRYKDTNFFRSFFEFFLSSVNNFLLAELRWMITFSKIVFPCKLS